MTEWYCGKFICRPSYERTKSFEDLQKDMEKLNKDIEALRAMDLDCTIMHSAIDELKEKKKEVLKQMHETIDKQYA